MKPILTVIKIALFLLAITFAVVNTDVVAVRYYFGIEWRAPMVFVLLAAFGIGIAAGVLVCLPYMVKTRFEVSRLKRAVRVAVPPTRDAPELPPGREVNAVQVMPSDTGKRDI